MEESLNPEGENPSSHNFLNFCKLVWIGLVCGSCDKDMQVNKKRGMYVYSKAIFNYLMYPAQKWNWYRKVAT